MAARSAPKTGGPAAAVFGVGVCVGGAASLRGELDDALEQRAGEEEHLARGRGRAVGRRLGGGLGSAG